MDYLQLIAEKPPEKAALITEEHTYTYGELAALARERRKRLAAHAGCIL